MPTAHVRLKPIQWFQEIGHYPKQGGDGRYLRATCTYDDDSNVRLSTGATISPWMARQGAGKAAGERSGKASERQRFTGRRRPRRTRKGWRLPVG